MGWNWTSLCVLNLIYMYVYFFFKDSSTIKVWVPTVYGRKVIKIAVGSLSEKVSSLMEKIANEIQMPAKDLKLRGKEGVLKGDKSLAQNDVETGEILTLTWRISRWY